MKNAKYYIWAIAAVVVIGGLALYWSKTHNIEYAIDANALEDNQDTKKSIVDDRENPLKVAQVGAVDLAVEFTSALEETADSWVFKVAMNTHSVDLESIDLYEAISFLDGSGRLIEEAFQVKSVGSGHHLTHYVLVPKVLEGDETIPRNAESISMLVKNIDGSEKAELTWNVPGLENLFNDNDLN